MKYQDLNDVARRNGFYLDSREAIEKAERLIAQKSIQTFGDRPASTTAAINLYASQHGIVLSNRAAFQDAEEGARKQWPEVFGLKKEVKGYRENSSSIHNLVFNEPPAGFVRVNCKGIC